MDDTNFEQKNANRWMAEKLDEVLLNACRIADLIQISTDQIPASNREDLIDNLFHIIWNSAQLSAFVKGTEESFSRDWVLLLLNEGVGRFEEYQERVDQKILAGDTHNLLPSPFNKIADLNNETHWYIENEQDNHTLVRERVLHLSAELKRSKVQSLKLVGDELEELVDKQAYHNSISWTIFVDEVRTKNGVLETLINEHLHNRKLLAK